MRTPATVFRFDMCLKFHDAMTSHPAHKATAICEISAALHLGSIPASLTVRTILSNPSHLADVISVYVTSPRKSNSAPRFGSGQRRSYSKVTSDM